MGPWEWWRGLLWGLLDVVRSDRGVVGCRVVDVRLGLGFVVWMLGDEEEIY